MSWFSFAWWLSLASGAAALALLGIFGVEKTLADASGAWAYALVFLLAATPWLEILLVIPPAIGLGLDPVAVTALAFFGNALAVYLIIVFQVKILAWWRNRYDDEESRRWRWARRLWERYGLVVLALVSPVVTGVHFGAILALLFGASGRAVAGWMTVSLLVWSVGLAVLTVVGVSLL